MINSDLEVTYLLISFIFFILVSSFCSGSETALFSLTQTKIKDLKDKYPKRGSIISRLLDQPQRLLTTILICNILANIMATIIAGQILKNYNIANPLIVILIMTFVILIFGEVTPKSIAIQSAPSISLFVAPIFFLLSRLLYPFIFGLRKITNGLVKLSSYVVYRQAEQSENYNSEEIIYAIKESKKQGVLNDTESHIIENIIDFSSMDLWKIIRPRNEIFSLPIETSLSETIEKLKEKKYSRIPVWENSEENIIGILYVKELIKIKDTRQTIRAVRNILLKPVFIPGSMKAEQLLKFFQTTKNHIALVIDEYGGISGLVTHEDILEAIIGEVVDKDDIIPLYHKYNPSMIEVEAKMDLDEFNRVFNIDLKSDEAASIGGYLLEKVKKIPLAGEIFIYNGLQFKISGAQPNKIEKILITKIRKMKKKKNNLFLP